MSSLCFVPKCKSTTGAPFPRDADTKLSWLEGLKLTHITPKAGSFVCFAHFKTSDLNEEGTPGTRLRNRLKRGAVPYIGDGSEADVTPTKSRTKVDEVKKSRSIIATKKSENNHEEQPEEEVSDPEHICRSCMTDKNLELTMFDLMEDEVTISAAFMMCAFPIQISECDNLPKDICKSCFGLLKIAYKFHKQCLQTDDALRERYKDGTGKRKAPTEDEPKKSLKKSRIDPLNKTSKTSKDVKTEEQPCKLADIGSSDAFEVIDDETEKFKPEDNENVQELQKENPSQSPIKVKTEATNDSEVVETVESELSSPSTRRSRRLAHKGDIKSKTPKSRKGKNHVDIDEIEKNLEEIHGQQPIIEDTEQPIVTEVPIETTRNSTPEIVEGTTVEDILNTLEEGNISAENQEVTDNEDVLEEFLQKKDLTPISPKKIIVKTNFPITKKKEMDLPESIKLPKDVKIKPVEKYQSSLGKFVCSYKCGVYDSLFVQVDNYLFELGLVKGFTRHLRCTLPTCASHGKQRVMDNGEFDTIVEVVTPHNHRFPNEATQKKQMFLCVMRKKMQTDRTLNIRVIYEDACTEDPDIKQLVPLRNVINEICRHQLTHKMKPITSFEDFFYAIESDPFEKLHFTHNNQQFYQEKFSIDDDESKAVVFGNTEVIQQVSASKVMYVDASFKIDTNEDFKYQLVTVLVWIDDSYYPIMFALVNKKSQLIFRKIFAHLRDELAPELRPQEIITDYEANLYYALAEVYIDSNIGGSVFYYTQNLYKKICSLNLSRDLETNSYFRNIYHMLLMLPLLPVNTILDGLNNIQLEATNLNITDLAQPIFDHVRVQWIINVTPELFCVHKLENRINENVIAPFKKLRDFLLLTKGKLQKTHVTIVHVIEKIIELEAFLRGMYSKPDKKSFGRDLSSFQKKNVLRAWQFIEDHPKIEINNFFSKVLGYIKCMENQLWIWGFYRYDGDTDDILINASHFSIVSPNEDLPDESEEVEEEEYVEYIEAPENTIVMDAVIDQDGVLQTDEEILTENVVTTSQPQQFENAFVKYVYQ